MIENKKHMLPLIQCLFLKTFEVEKFTQKSLTPKSHTFTFTSYTFVLKISQKNNHFLNKPLKQPKPQNYVFISI